MQRMKLEGKVLQLVKQLRNQPSTTHPQFLYQVPASAITNAGTISSGQRRFSLRWGEERNMPCSMVSGCDAVVKGTIVYFVVAGSLRVYNFNTNDNTCFSLPDCPFFSSSITVVNDLLTAVGGLLLDSSGTVKNFSNKLFSFMDAGV